MADMKWKVMVKWQDPAGRFINMVMTRASTPRGRRYHVALDRCDGRMTRCSDWAKICDEPGAREAAESAGWQAHAAFEYLVENDLW